MLLENVAHITFTSHSHKTTTQARVATCQETKLRKYIDTYENKIMRYETNHQITLWHMLLLHCTLKLWIIHAHTQAHTNPHNEHAAFFSVYDVKLSVTGVFFKRLLCWLNTWNVQAHLAPLIRPSQTPPTSCTCIVVEAHRSEGHPSRKTGHACQDGRGCVQLGREKMLRESYMHTHTQWNITEMPMCPPGRKCNLYIAKWLKQIQTKSDVPDPISRTRHSAKHICNLQMCFARCPIAPLITRPTGISMLSMILLMTTMFFFVIPPFADVWPLVMVSFCTPLLC